MAHDKKPDQVRREALAAIQQGREGLGAEWRVIRHNLNPAHAARSAVRDHPRWALGAGVAAGLLIFWLCAPRRPTAHARDVRRAAAAAERAARAAHQAQAASTATPLSFVGTIISTAVKASLPLLARTVIDLIQRKTKPGHP